MKNVRRLFKKQTNYRCFFLRCKKLSNRQKRRERGLISSLLKIYKISKNLIAKRILFTKRQTS